MAYFIKKILLFLCIPLVCLIFVELLLPSNMFTFRTWEAARTCKQNGDFLIGPFYPANNIKMIEEGDLAYHTEYAIKKDVEWKTDRLGYRNDLYNPMQEIILVGDSNITGSSLSQEETLTFALELQTGISVYNVSPADITTFIGLMNAGLFERPKLIIVSIIERDIYKLSPVNPLARTKFSSIRLNPIMQFLAVQIDKLRKANSLQYLKSRMNRKRSSILSVGKDGKMVFGSKIKKRRELTDEDIDGIIKTIMSYSNYCNSIGSQFMFFPIPNKETIYWDIAGLPKQPMLLSRICAKLQENGIKIINTQNLFNKLRENGIRPYHFDDSHWNKDAVSAVAKEIVKTMNIGQYHVSMDM